jgi:hypothetical protein
VVTKVVQMRRTWQVPLVVLGSVACWVLLESSTLAQEKLPLIKRLDGPTRAKVLAALAALVILGFAMVALAWLGARVTRRYMKGTSYLRPTSRPERSDWSPQPLKPGDKLADEPDEEGGS